MKTFFIILTILIVFLSLRYVFAINMGGMKGEKFVYDYPYTTIPHLDTAIYYLNIGVKEETNNNDGKYVEKFLKSQNLKKGMSWCTSFVSYCLSSNPDILLTVRSGRAQDFDLKHSISAKDVMYGKKKVPPGSIVIWKNGKTNSGHTGFVYIWENVQGQTIEGNADNKISFLNRKIEPRNYHRIVSFTLVPYKTRQQILNNKYVPKWYKEKTLNNDVIKTY